MFFPTRTVSKEILQQFYESYCNIEIVFYMIKRFLKYFVDIKRRRQLRTYAKIDDSTIDRGIRLRLDNPSNKKYLEVGKENIIGSKFIFESEEGKVKIGNNCCIIGCTFISRSQIVVGNYVHIAWGTYLYDHDSHSLNSIYRRKDNIDELCCIKNNQNFIKNKDWSVVRSEPIVVHDDAWIGMNAVIFGGVTIGRGAVVGAGSYVRSNIPPYAVVIGNPAKIIGFTAPPEELEIIEKENYKEEERIPLSDLERNYMKYYQKRIKELKSRKN